VGAHTWTRLLPSAPARTGWPPPRIFAGEEVSVFGDPMSFWRPMPAGMLLRPNWTATCIAEYDGPLSLYAYLAMSLLRGGRDTPVSRSQPVRGVSPAIPVGRAKRSMDLILAATGMVVASPLLLLIYGWACSPVRTPVDGGRRGARVEDG
jgi:hypothetical protein